MKLSIITTFTSKRQDAWREAIECYSALADEVVVIYDFAETNIAYFLENFQNVRELNMNWPFEYEWSEFPRHYNYALEQARADWVIKLDIDMLIHERDFDRLRKTLEGSDAPVASLNKESIYGTMYFSKGEVVNIVNKNRFPELRFGGTVGEKGNDDLVGIINPIEKRRGDVPYGTKPTRVLKTGVDVFNFDYTFKDEKTAHRDFARMARAFKRYFDSDSFGKDDNDAIEKYKMLRLERANKATQIVDEDMIPKFIKGKYFQTL